MHSALHADVEEKMGLVVPSLYFRDSLSQESFP